MNLMGKAADKKFWEYVRFSDNFKRYRDDTIGLWNTHCENSSIMALKYSDYKLFFTTGDRKVYENTYFTRRLAMDSSAILSMIYPEEEKYLTRLMDQIYAICDEYTWCLPAHQPCLEKNDNTHIDLFAAETGFALAEIYSMLSDRLDPLIKSRIEAEIDRRILTPFVTLDPKSHWETWTHNWNAVCVGSVACTYMLMRPDLAEKLIPRFERALEHYLSGFCDDGMCLEGNAYWMYGFGFFTVYSDMVKTFTKGAIDHFAEPKIKTIATYLQKMCLTKNTGVSFADAGTKFSYQLGLQHYLKSIYPDAVLVYPIEYAYIHDHCGRFCLGLRSATWFNEDYFKNPDPVSSETEFFAENSQWLIKKNANYSLAAKGGNNKEPHNHNDVGSFIFAKNGKQVLIDPGSGLYTRQYFNPQTRYTIFETTSAAHNLPIINGELQKFGAQFKAKKVSLANGIFSMDIAPAYGIEELSSLERSFKFEDDCVVMTDVFDYRGKGNIIERFISIVRPVISAGSITLDDTVVELFPSCDCTVSTKSIKNGVTVYLIDIKIPEGKRKFTCKIK